MKRLIGWILIAIIIMSGGLVLAQTSTADTFQTIQQIGLPPPQAILYNPPLDQFAWVVAGGELQLVDAKTFTVQHSLYTNRTYQSFAFSRNGQYFAVALDRKVDLIDAATGTLLETFEPEGILDIAGPLQFADDNGLLLVNTVVPAPQATRRSENDTSILPWLWDIPDALDIAPSSLPNRAQAYAFFDYRNGFVLADNDKAIAGRPARLEILDVGGAATNVITAEAESSRFERDAVNAWRSLLTDAAYIEPQGEPLQHIDTSTGTIAPIASTVMIGAGHPVRRDLWERLNLSGATLPIGAANSLEQTSLATLLLGNGYGRRNPVTVTLLDILEPITPTAQSNRFIVYVQDQREGEGRIEIVEPAVRYTALSPNRQQIAFYANRDTIDIYDIASGALLRSFIPAHTDTSNDAIFSFDPTGTAILYDFQRFDVAGGTVINQNLNIGAQFNDYYFSPDASRLTTINYYNDSPTHFDWWQWDIRSGEPVRREEVILRGSLVQVDEHAEQFIAVIDSPSDVDSTTTYEYVNVALDTRHTVTFDALPNRVIQQILLSPDTKNALVIYEPDPTQDYYIGGELVMYDTVNDQQLWLITGDDLVYLDERTIRWQDNNTVAIFGNDYSYGYEALPVRTYGIEYDGSGFPGCLSEAFPNDYEQWINIWRLRTAHMDSNQLNALAAQACAAIPTAPTTIDNILTTPTPTRYPTIPARWWATQPVLANVPECITRADPEQAPRVAEIWRSISADLDAEAVAELEEIVCDGIRYMGYDYWYPSDDTFRALLIDAQTGERTFTVTLDAPQRDETPRLDLVQAEYARLNNNRNLSEPRINHDGTLVAHRVGRYIRIDRVAYPQLIANAEATEQFIAAQTPIVPVISMRPTSEPTQVIFGLPNPTFTPTAIFTPLPYINNVSDLHSDGESLHDFCEPDASLYSIDNPPPDFAPNGTILANLDNSTSRIYELSPNDGRAIYNDRIPDCFGNENCNLSPDRSWHLGRYANNADETLYYVQSLDGETVRLLTDNQRQNIPLDTAFWNATENIVEFQYSGYLFELNPPEITTFYRQYSVDNDTFSPPVTVTPYSPIRVDLLQATEVYPQPVLKQWAMVSINLAGEIYFYMLNLQTEETTLFHRNSETAGYIRFEWHPDGKALYYQLPDNSLWLIFDPETETHSVLGEYIAESGYWSTDGRYRVEYRQPPSEEVQERLDADLPSPRIYVWDSETGETRRYCLPAYDPLSVGTSRPLWSPDSRYVTVQYRLPERFLNPIPTLPPGITATPFYGVRDLEADYLSDINRTFLVDVETGSVTEISNEASDLIAWLPTEGE